MRTLAIGILLCALGGAQQGSRQYASYSTDVNGRAVQGPSWSETETLTSFNRTLSGRSINGQVVPQQSVQQRLVSETPREKVFERTVQPYDYDGKPLPPQKTQIQERKNPDGSTTVSTSTYQQDLNGHMQFTERATSRIIESGTGRSESTVVERQTLSGSIEVVEKRNAVVTKSPGQEQGQVMVYRKGINGDFYEASREVIQRTREPGLLSETSTRFEAGASGRLDPATQTVTRARTLADKSEIQESTVYRPWTGGRVNVSGGMQASEQYLVERKPAAGNAVVETTSVRKPSLDFPHAMGTYEKLSEVICTGQCQTESKK